MNLNADGNVRILSVSELNRAVRMLLEQNLPLAWVGGEISNFTRAASGHWYFSLKDATAQVRCVMFRNRTAMLDFQPVEGMKVELRAVPGMYEPRGEFQLTVDFMRRAGLGALYEAFGKLKEKLEREGLFAATRKRELPAFARRIGIVTSPAAAALKDVLTTLQRRMPGLPVVLYPTPVQGEAAPAQIVAAIRAASSRGECDVLIVCRGGGSIEDLWAFNDETVARAIADCSIPVVSGIGHETDFTIADFVADRRAPTPTAAAELVSPNRVELGARLLQLARRLNRDMDRILQLKMQQLDYLGRRLVHPGERLHNQQLHLDQLRLRLAQAMSRQMENRQWRLRALAQALRQQLPDIALLVQQERTLARRLQRAQQDVLQRAAERLARAGLQLASLNPRAVLARGYSIVQDESGALVMREDDVAPGERLLINLAQGQLTAIVRER